MNSPIPPPHPNMVFKGYVATPEGGMAAFFSDKTRKFQPGVRKPKGKSGGINKLFFDGLRDQRTDEDRARFKRNNSHLFTPRSKRWGKENPGL